MAPNCQKKLAEIQQEAAVKQMQQCIVDYKKWKFSTKHDIDLQVLSHEVYHLKVIVNSASVFLPYLTQTIVKHLFKERINLRSNEIKSQCDELQNSYLQIVTDLSCGLDMERELNSPFSIF